MKKIFKKFGKFFLGLLIFLIVLAGGLFAVYHFRNTILTNLIEKNGSKVYGAKLDVDSLKFEPFEGTLSWNRFQMTDRDNTMKNLFEFGRTEINLEIKPLLAKKVIMNKVQLVNFKMNSDRAEDGYIEPEPKKDKKPKKDSKIAKMVTEQIKKKIMEEKEKIPVFDPASLKAEIDVDSVFALLELQTPGKIDSLQKIADERYAYWDDKLKNNTYEKDYKEIEKLVNSINLKNTDDIEEMLKSLNNAKKVYDKSQKLFKEAKELKKNFSKDMKLLNGLRKDVPKWVKSDYNKALNIANLPSSNVEDIAKMLFGDKLSNGLMMAIGYIQMSREIKQEKPETADAEPKEEKYPELPNFWLKELTLSGEAGDGLKIKGQVFNISSDQDRINTPITAKLNGSRAGLFKAGIDATLDHRNNQFHENVKITATEIPLAGTKLSNFALLPERLDSGEANFSAEIDLMNSDFVSTVGFKGDKLRFSDIYSKKLNKHLLRIAKRITSAINVITFDAKISQKNSDYSFDLNSNLDNLIAREMKKALSAEVERAKQELRKRVDKEIAKYRKQLDDQINKQKQKLDAEMKKLQDKIDKQLAKVKAKQNEVQGKIDKEKKKKEDELKKKAGKEAEKLLDNLFK
eukprot:Anaeramoba_ignava/a217569_31.p1 GENE.a217569_31~~a217569_31.p1  ORF type:complete len:629 (-),score=103.68 a217569_31:134-2020(-)